MLLLIAALCGCGGTAQEGHAPREDKTPQETRQPVSPSETAALPDRTDTGEPRSVAELYEATAMEHVFRLDTVRTDGYSVEQSFLQDGYVLLLMRDFSAQGYENEAGMQHVLNSGKLILFPLDQPEAAVSLDIEQFKAHYVLLADGTVLEVSWEGGYTLYDSALKVIGRESADCGGFLGASAQGDIWFLTEDGSFVLHRNSTRLQTEPVEGMMHGRYLETRGGKAYFTMYNRYYGWTYSCVDPENMTYEEGRTLSSLYDAHGGLLCYSSEDRWFIADCADPLMVTAFTKPFSNESVWSMDGRYLIGAAGDYDAAADTFRRDYHVYDLCSGGLCGQISSDDFPGCDLFLQAMDHGVALLAAHDTKTQETKGLYLWDVNSMPADAPAPVYETLDFHMNRARVDALVQEIYDRYGVTVYFDAAHLEAYSAGYDLVECSDMDLIGYTLLRMNECMAEYPEGFFEEIRGERIRDVVFCLCGAHDRTDPNSIEDAAATVTTVDDTLRMSIDVHYWQDFRRIFLHENTHMMENRLEEELQKISSRNYTEYWYKELNLPDCPPIQGYIWEQTEETLKGTYDADPANACYIDWYSKCTINEDHARIMENGIYSGSAHYFTAPFIDRKSRFLNAMIRAAFPCVGNSGEVFWEQRTGIVDLYQEFPDFVGQR